MNTSPGDLSPLATGDAASSTAITAAGRIALAGLKACAVIDAFMARVYRLNTGAGGQRLEAKGHA